MRRPSPSMVVALVALFVALSGTSYAVIKLPAKSVGNRELKSNAVTGSKVRSRSIARSDLAPSARTGARGSRGPTGPAGPAGAAGVVGTPEPWKPLAFAANWTNWGDIHVTDGTIIRSTPPAGEPDYTSLDSIGLWTD